MASRRDSAEPAAPLPESERKALSVGIAFALACAAALSAPTLYQLARLIGFAAALAWLLPAALDGYAGTSIWIGRRITRAHPAARAARRNARLALILTIACNGLYHLLALAGNSIPRGVHIGLLVTVSSLPPFIVDRLLHLNAIANGTGATATDPATATKVSSRRDDATRPVVAALPGAPVARPERPATSPAASVAPAAAPDATGDATPATFHPRSEIDDVVLALIAEHGADNVTGPMVGEAIGKHRATGDRHLKRVLKAVKDGALTLPAPDAETEARRQSAEFLDVAR